jgi:hypothetical protein
MQRAKCCFSLEWSVLSPLLYPDSFFLNVIHHRLSRLSIGIGAKQDGLHIRIFYQRENIGCCRILLHRFPATHAGEAAIQVCHIIPAALKSRIDVGIDEDIPHFHISSSMCSKADMLFSISRASSIDQMKKDV